MKTASDLPGKKPRSFPQFKSLTTNSIRALIMLVIVIITCATWFWWPKETDVSFPLVAATDDHLGASVDTDTLIQSPTEFDSKPTNPSSYSATIKIYVCGAVLNPGVYDLTSGMRTCDAVAAAGGMLETAAVGYVNLAAIVQDGEQIAIPTQSELESGQYVSPASANSVINASSNPQFNLKSEALVNINTADVMALDTLPGIGPTTAQRIVDYRVKNGPFDSVDALRDVSGIGDKKYADLADRIRI